MELWIRSQNKELLMKSPELRYNQKGNEHSLLAYDTLGVYRILGTYKSKERTLEILGEIQQVMIEQTAKNERSELIGGLMGGSIPKREVFIQMPEE